jgi:methanogenic corrinoid protein MtbC1
MSVSTSVHEADQGGGERPMDYGAIRGAYLDALLAGDSTRARHVIDAAADSGAIAELYLRVLQPVMEDVGTLWSAGHVNVAQEHYATAITAGVMVHLGSRWRRAPTSGRLAVVSCSPGERHQLGSQMVSDFLEAAGWEVLPLGADVPTEDLVALVELERPDVVAMSTSMREQLPTVVHTLGELRRIDPRPYLVVGGRAWFDLGDERARAAGADARVLDPAQLVATVQERFPPVDDDED